MKRRYVGRHAFVLAALSGVVVVLSLLFAGTASAQVTDSVIEVDGITVVTGPSSTVVEVEADGLELFAIAFNSPAYDVAAVAEAEVGDIQIDSFLFTGSSPTFSSFSGASDVRLPGIEADVVVSATSTPTTSSFFAAADVEADGQAFDAFFGQSCVDGVVTTATSVGPGGGGGGSAAAAAAAEDGTSAAAVAAPSCPTFPPTEPPVEPGPEPGPTPEPDPGPEPGPTPGPDPGTDPGPGPVPAPEVTQDSPAPSGDATPEVSPAPAPVAEPESAVAPASEELAPPAAPGPVTGPPAPSGPPAAAPGAAAVEPPVEIVLASTPLLVAPVVAATVASPSEAPAAVAPPAPAATPGPEAAAPGPAPAAPTPPAISGAGRIALTALTRAGLATGPPGVGVTISGTGFPPRIGRASRPFAAPWASAQAAECDTIYLFFDGARIGSTRPDAAGNIRRSGLSVPGGVDPGIHAVTASCRSAGTPILASTEFAVTDADPHRSAFVTALPRPDHVDFSVDSLLLSALGALGILLLIAFPAELFNSTLEANYDEVRGWFGLRPRPSTAGTGVSNVALFVLFLALSGPLWFSMQSSSALDAATVLAALGLSLATAVVVLAADLPTFAHLRRRYGEGASVIALPGTLIVALLCVLLSRAVRFEPGYFYGLVGGLAFSRQLRRDTSGRLAAASVVAMVGLSVAAWLLLVPVSRIADRPDAGALPIFIEGFLGGVFWVALDSLVIALLPLRLLTGDKIVGWSRAAWALLYGATLFAFIHILLRPGTGYVSDTSRSPTVVVVGLFVAFAIFSFTFWGYFRFRTPRPEDKGAVPV